MLQGIGARVRRDNLRQTWVLKGKAMRDLERRGIYIRFVVGYRCVSSASAQRCMSAASLHNPCSPSGLCDPEVPL